jgi:hypothetical protein
MPSPSFRIRRRGLVGLLAVLLASSNSKNNLLPTAHAQDVTLASNDVPCGGTIATLSPVALADVLRDAATVAGTNFGFFVASQVVPNLQYGLEVRKICGSCADVADLDAADLCPPTTYGYDATHSGLLLIPTEATTGEWKAGTSLLHVHMHGATRTTQAVPSQNLPNLFVNTTSGSDTFISLVLSATAGVVTIVPDFLGMGEAAATTATLLPSSFVRQGYITSTWPLIALAQQVVAEESNCTSLVADDVLVTGYSEGGYAAVALLPAFEAMGWTVVRAYVGAVAARLSSVQITGTFAGFSAGTIDPSLRFIIPFLAAAYSSTSSDVTSAGAGQDILRAQDRDIVLDRLATTTEFEGLNNLTAPDDPLSFFSAPILAFLEAAVANNITDPCNSDLVVVGETDQLCAALQANDLVDVIENSIGPITILHSPDDELVPFENLPNLTANPLLTYIPLQGGHSGAGAEYLVIVISAFQTQVDLGNFPTLEAAALARCPPSVAGIETDAPTYSPTSAPSAAASRRSPVVVAGVTAALLLTSLLGVVHG